MITNNFNLPEPLFKALSRDRYAPIAGRISATALIEAPLQRVLLMKYTDHIVEDASEKLFALMGQAVHKVIELRGSKEVSELKQICKHDSGATLVTIGDYYAEQVITDWKLVSIWMYLLSGKVSWTRQLNVVRYIYERCGLPVKEAQVYAIFRDWTKNKSYERDYPDIPFAEYKIKLWSDEELNKYIDDRVSAHLFAESLIDSIPNIPICSEEERWQRPTTYAVKRKGIKKAMRVLDTMSLAEEWLNKQKDKGLYIETRAGMAVRCMSYCPTNRFCEFYNALPIDGQEE